VKNYITGTMTNILLGGGKRKGGKKRKKERKKERKEKEQVKSSLSTPWKHSSAGR
jgi:hypothetical protein